MTNEEVTVVTHAESSDGGTAVRMKSELFSCFHHHPLLAIVDGKIGKGVLIIIFYLLSAFAKQ